MITETNKKTRDKAIPFEATSFRNNAGGAVNAGAIGTSDAGLIISSDLLVAIRCCTPDRGALTEAHLNLIMNVHSATTVKVAIGRFDADGVTAVSSYTQAEIDAMHQKITGSSSAIASSAGVLFLDGLNVFPFIPKRGDTNFNADGFVILLQFSRARNGANDKYGRFAVMCSAQMGLL